MNKNFQTLFKNSEHISLEQIVTNYLLSLEESYVSRVRIEDLTSQINTALEDLSSIEKIRSLLHVGAVAKPAMEQVSLLMQNICQRQGMVYRPKYFALENSEGSGYAVEGLGDFLKSVWEAIVKAVGRLVDFITGFFTGGSSDGGGGGGGSSAAVVNSCVKKVEIKLETIEKREKDNISKPVQRLSVSEAPSSKSKKEELALKLIGNQFYLDREPTIYNSLRKCCEIMANNSSSVIRLFRYLKDEHKMELMDYLLLYEKMGKDPDFLENRLDNFVDVIHRSCFTRSKWISLNGKQILQIDLIANESIMMVQKTGSSPHASNFKGDGSRIYGSNRQVNFLDRLKYTDASEFRDINERIGVVQKFTTEEMNDNLGGLEKMKKSLDSVKEKFITSEDKEARFIADLARQDIGILSLVIRMATDIQTDAQNFAKAFLDITNCLDSYTKLNG